MIYANVKHVIKKREKITDKNTIRKGELKYKIKLKLTKERSLREIKNKMKNTDSLIKFKSDSEIIEVDKTLENIKNKIKKFHPYIDLTILEGLSKEEQLIKLKNIKILD